MKKMDITKAVTVFLCAVLLFCGCVRVEGYDVMPTQFATQATAVSAPVPTPTVYPQLAEVPLETIAPTPSLPPEATAVPAWMFMDINLDLYVLFKGTSWIYQRDEANSQIICYAGTQQNYTKDAKLILYSGEKPYRFEDFLSEKEGEIAKKDTVSAITKTEISVGGYLGVRLNYTTGVGDALCICSLLLWETQSRVYTCSAFATQEYAQTVETAVDGIMESFEPLAVNVL